MFKTAPKIATSPSGFEDEDKPFKIALGLFALSTIATSTGVLLATMWAT